MDAAYRVMSRVGVEATTISQITEEADVGFGSFYNYFSSKEEIARTVFHEQLAAFSDHLDRTNAGIEDPSVRLSRNIFRILSQARIDPVWGWFFVHGEYALQELRSVFWMNHQRNLKQGLQLGVYQFDVSPLTVGDIAFGATNLGHALDPRREGFLGCRTRDGGTVNGRLRRFRRQGADTRERYLAPCEGTSEGQPPGPRPTAPEVSVGEGGLRSKPGGEPRADGSSEGSISTQDSRAALRGGPS